MFHTTSCSNVAAVSNIDLLLVPLYDTYISGCSLLPPFGCSHLHLQVGWILHRLTVQFF